MTTAISPISRQMSKPYLSLQEYKNAPTALDYGNLVQGGNQAAQDAELTNAITRASSHIDQYCNQILSATVDTEQQRTRFRTDGTVAIHPKYWPVVALTNLSVGGYPNQLTAVSDPSLAWLEEQSIIYPLSSGQTTWSSQGALSFAFPANGRQVAYVNYTYINGYPNAAIAANSSVGATSITVNDPTGITAGESLTIYDGASTERVTVSSSYTFGSSTVTLAAGTLYAHTAGVNISALPAAIKQAAILITSVYLKIRGDASLTLAVTNTPGQSIVGGQMIGNDMAEAHMLLQPFRRIR